MEHIGATKEIKISNIKITIKERPLSLLLRLEAGEEISIKEILDSCTNLKQDISLSYAQRIIKEIEALEEEMIKKNQ